MDYEPAVRLHLAYVAFLGCLASLATVWAEEPSPADEPEWLMDAIHDPSQLNERERYVKLREWVELLEEDPETPNAGRVVGSILWFRGAITDKIAQRVAAVLEDATGESFGTDFDAWVKWYDSKKDEEEWKPIHPVRMRKNPKAIPLLPPHLVVYAPTIRDDVDGWKVLSPPCALACREAGFYVEGQAEIRFRPPGPGVKPRLESTAPFAVSCGSSLNAIAMADHIDIVPFWVFIDYIDQETLRKVSQEVDEARMAEQDPEKFLTYLADEARQGNFRPLVRHYMSGEEPLGRGNPEFRSEAAEHLRLSVKEVQAMSEEQLVTELLRAEYVDHFQFLYVSVRKKQDDRVHAEFHRFGGSHGHSLVYRDGKWVPGR